MGDRMKYYKIQNLKEVHKWTKNKWDMQKTNSKMVDLWVILLITLNVKGMKPPIKRQRLSG